jgi:hypothetical protein
MRKVTAEIKVRVILNMDQGVEVGEVVQAMECEFADTTGHADVENAEILDHQVTDSR